MFTAKYRKCIFAKEMLDCMRGIFESVCADFESSLVEFDGEGNHVHLLVYPPKVTLSKLFNSLKGVSIRLIRRELSKDVNRILWKGVLWSPSYFAGSCGGAPLDMVKNYIKN